MATNKFLQSISEDPQLEKQIGCMAGILQIFDRHQVLTGRRLYGHKRIASAARSNQPVPSCGSPGSDDKVAVNHSPQRHYSEETLKQAAELLATPRLPVETSVCTSSKSSGCSEKKVSPAAMDMARMSLDSRQQQQQQQPPRASLDMRGSGPSPQKLDSSRSLQEGRFNPVNEGKLFPRRSVDIAERARGAFKEFSKNSSDIEAAPLNIRDIVRASFQKESVIKSGLDRIREHSEAVPKNNIANSRSSLVNREGTGRPWSGVVSSEVSKNQKDSFSVQAPPPAQGKDHNCKLPHGKPNCNDTSSSSRTVADLNESLRLLAKMRESAPGSWTLNDYSARGQMQSRAPSGETGNVKEGSRLSVSRDQPPRCSYDGRYGAEPPRFSSADHRELLRSGSQRAPSTKEMPPRLSLDGRLTSPGASSAKLLPRSLNSRSVSCNNSDCDNESLHSGKRSSSASSNVVARLMGLDDLPLSSNSGPQPINKLSAPELHAKPPQKQLAYSGPPGNSRAPAWDAATETYPKFSQCGKYVSASFFPSKRRDSISISLNSTSDEEEEEGSFSFESSDAVSSKTEPQPPSFVNPRYAFGNSYNPVAADDHHAESRIDHLASVSKLCMQIEEMQRTDNHPKDVDRKFLGAIGSQSSKQDLQALKQLLESLHVKDHSQAGIVRVAESVDSRTSRPNERWVYGRLQQDSMISPADQWKTKKGLTEQQQEQHSSCNTRNRIVDVKPVLTRVAKAGGRSRCPSPDQSPRSKDGRSNNSSPKKGGNARTPARSEVTNGSPRRNGGQANSLASASANSSPTSSRVSSPVKGQSLTAARSDPLKQRKCDSVNKRAGGVIKDREESRANLVSLKSHSVTRKNGVSAPGACVNSRPDRRVQSTGRSKSSRTSANPAPPCKPGKMDMGEDDHFTDKEVVTDCATSPSKSLSEKDVNVLSSTETSPSSASMQERFLHIPVIADCSWAQAAVPDAKQFGSSTENKPWMARDQPIKTGASGLQVLEEQTEDTESQGDKSTGSCEQPSPVSVLDAPFYQGDVSPKLSKCSLKFEEHLTVSEGYGASKGEEDYNTLARTGRNNSLGIDECEGLQESDANGVSDEDYVREILEMVGSPTEIFGKVGIVTSVLSPVEPHVFLVLEAKRNKKVQDGGGAGGKIMAISENGGGRRRLLIEEQEMLKRRLIFDAVNESLRAKLRDLLLLHQQPWVLLRPGLRWRRSSAWLMHHEDDELQLSSSDSNDMNVGSQLMAEVTEDVQRMSKLHIRNSSDDAEALEMEDQEGRRVCDSVSRLLEEDLLEPAAAGGCGNASDDWHELLPEKGEIALDIERLIFKDLIDHTIRGLAASSTHTFSPASTTTIGVSNISTSTTATSTCRQQLLQSSSCTRRQLFASN